MKNIIKITLLFLGLGYFSSCSENEFIKYDTTQKDGLYIQESEIDSVFYTYGYSTEDSYTETFRVYLSGEPKDYERTIQISVDNDRYDGLENTLAALPEYYSIPDTYPLEANAIYADLPVTLYRHEDLKETTAIVTFDFIENEDFEIRGNNEFSITFNDKEPEKPEWWLEYILGYYSYYKIQVFFEYFRASEEDNQIIYDQIVTRWGYYLDDDVPNIEQDNPFTIYREFFDIFVLQPLYDHAQESGDPELADIPEP